MMVATPASLNGGFDELYQLAAETGGAGYLLTGDNDTTVVSSALVNQMVWRRSHPAWVRWLITKARPPVVMLQPKPLTSVSYSEPG